jgi:hypothetical protein
VQLIFGRHRPQPREVSRLAEPALVRREGLKVALSGLGGDELFGGYPSFARVASGWARLLGRVPGGVRRAVVGGRWSVDHGFSTRMGKLADLLSGEGTLTDVVLEGRALFSVGQVGRLMGDAGGGRWAVDGGRWAVDSGRWTVGGGRWTVDGGRWTVDGGRWTVGAPVPRPNIGMFGHYGSIRLGSGCCGWRGSWSGGRSCRTRR